MASKYWYWVSESIIVCLFLYIAYSAGYSHGKAETCTPINIPKTKVMT